MTGETVPRQGHRPAIDGLRAFAVASVLIFHAFLGKVPGAFIGVDVFFVISGFVITTSLVGDWQVAGRIGWLAFYRRRFWRLMPALIAMVVLSSVVEALFPRVGWGQWAKEAAFALTYTYNVFQGATGGQGMVIDHTWTLGIEEQFYLVWPLALTCVLARLRGRQRLVATGILIGCCFAGRAVTTAALDPRHAFFFPWDRFDELLMGGLLALAISEGEAAVVRQLQRPAPAVGAAAILLIAVEAIRHTFESYLLYGGFTMLALVAAVLVGHAAVGGETRFNALLCRPPLVWIGQRSYSIYLYHYPLVIACRYEHTNAIITLLVSAVGSVAVAAVSFTYLETPLRRRGSLVGVWVVTAARGRRYASKAGLRLGAMVASVPAEATYRRAVVLMTVTSFLVPLAGLVTAPILARALDVSGRGELAASLAPAGLMLAAATMGLPDALTYFVAKRPEFLRRALTWSGVITGGLALLCVAIVFLSLPFLRGGNAHLGHLILLAAALTVPALTVGVIRGAAIGAQMWRAVAVERLILTGGRVIGFGSLYGLHRLTVTTAVLVNVVLPIIAGSAYLGLRSRPTDPGHGGLSAKDLPDLENGPFELDGALNSPRRARLLWVRSRSGCWCRSAPGCGSAASPAWCWTGRHRC